MAQRYITKQYEEKCLRGLFEVRTMFGGRQLIKLLFEENPVL